MLIILEHGQDRLARGGDASGRPSRLVADPARHRRHPAALATDRGIDIGGQPVLARVLASEILEHALAFRRSKRRGQASHALEEITAALLPRIVDLELATHGLRYLGQNRKNTSLHTSN